MENLKIIHEKENNLFNRREIQIEINAKITPKKSEAEESISKKFDVPKENIKVIRILGKFGSNDFVITANLYKSKADREKTEFKSKKEKESESKQAIAEKTESTQ